MMQSTKKLKDFLDAKVDMYNRESFIEGDPVCIPHGFTLLQDREIGTHVPHWVSKVFLLPWPEKLFALGEKFMPGLSGAPMLGVILFVLLAISLFISARKKLNQS